MIDVFDGILAARLCGGGSGGTSDYTQLANKPSINGTILVGNKTLSDLGIEWLWRGTRAQYEAAKATIPPNTFVDITDEPDMDTVPTQGSLNPVTSNGLWTELSKLKVINENPENHNGIYRGKDLTNVYTIEQMYAKIHDGSFEDLYLGDYFTVNITTDLYTRFTGSAFESGVKYYEMGGTVIARTWTETQDETPQSGKVYATKQVVAEDVDLMIAHFDYYLHMGYPANLSVENHHLLLIPRNVLASSNVISRIATEAYNGYANSDMHNITLPCYAASIAQALNGHILTRNDRLPTTIDPLVPSKAGGDYVGATIASQNATYKLALPSENQIFGTGILASNWRDICMDYYKFAVFNFIDSQEGVNANGYFTRTFAYVKNGSDATYAYINKGGLVSALSATAANANYAKIRPYFLFG